MSERDLDARVIQWISTLPPQDQVPQVQMYKAYKKVMDAPLANWYLRESYHWEVYRRECLYKDPPK